MRSVQIRIVIRPRLAVALFLAVIASGTPVVAATWYVYADGSGDAQTIQAAVDQAAAGDIVLVGPGVWRDLHSDSQGVPTVLELRSGVDVESLEGPAATILDADLEAGDRRCVSAWGVLDAGLVGFTIRKGNLYTGAGVYLHESDVSIRDNWVLDNYSGEGCGITVSGEGGSDSHAEIRGNLIAANIACCGPGGGILVNFGAEPQIEGNVIRDNSSWSGGAISCLDAGAAVIRRNLLRNNLSLSGGGLSVFNSPTLVAENWIVDNRADEGGGVACWNASQARFERNVVARNTANGSGGAYFITSCAPELRAETMVGNVASIGAGVFAWMDASPRLERSIVAFNLGAEGIYSDDPGSLPTVTCVDAFGNEYGNYGGFLSDLTGIDGNVSVDPVFCDLERGSYFLSGVSPLRDGTCGVLGALQAKCPALDLLSVYATGDLVPHSWGSATDVDPLASAVDEGADRRNPNVRGRLHATPNPTSRDEVVQIGFDQGTASGSTSIPAERREVRLFDAHGREVGQAAPQGDRWFWGGRNRAGLTLPSGTYWAVLFSGEQRVAVGRIVRR